jgi:regulator of protease activity HflC (stomatin/prohibitin superfamily)
METARKEAERLTIEAEGQKKHNAILAESLTDKVLQREQIEAMRDLAKSPNAKTLIMGGGQGAGGGSGAAGDSKLMVNVTP